MSDSAPAPISPIGSRRKHDFRLTRLQSEVMTRARSTLSGLGDVLKSRVNGVPPPTPTSISSPSSTPPRSPKTPNAVKNTLDFLWPRNRRSLKEKSDKKGTKKLSEERRSRSSTRVEARRLSRNQSVDISEIQSRRQSRAEEFSRSMDDGIHYLSDDDDSDRPKSYNDTFDFLREYDQYTRNCIRNESKKNPRHILFNDEDDVFFFKTSPSPGKTTAVTKLPPIPTPASGILRAIPRNTVEAEAKVISARLKIQPPEDLPPVRHNISTVIIEEQERDITHHDAFNQEKTGAVRRRALNKQPSFDQHEIKSDTLPRVKNKRITDLETEERFYRSGSLDLELEVEFYKKNG